MRAIRAAMHALTNRTRHGVRAQPLADKQSAATGPSRKDGVRMSNRSKADGCDREWHDDPLAQVAASPSPAQALPAPATAPAPLRTLAAARPPSGARKRRR